MGSAKSLLALRSSPLLARTGVDDINVKLGRIDPNFAAMHTCSSTRCRTVYSFYSLRECRR